MAFTAFVWVASLALFQLSLGQESTSGLITVTDTSTLAIVILPSATNSSLATSFTTSTFSTAFSTPTPSVIALPVTPYTGQSILVGTCDIPQYTMLYLADNGQLEVPLVGCSDDRPDCCPNVSGSNNYTLSPTGTSSTEYSSGSASPTGVVSLYSARPLTVCPADFTDIDPICCPSGFALFAQALAGNQTPCYSHLTTTISLPPNVLASISSYAASTAVASAEAMTTTTASTAVVQVIVNTVYALGLPCADNKKGNNGEQSGLGSGAKAGIGVGVGVGALILITMLWWGCLLARRRREAKKVMSAGPNGQRHGDTGMTMPGYGANAATPVYGGGGPTAYYDNVLRNGPIPGNSGAKSEAFRPDSMVSGANTAVPGMPDTLGGAAVHYPSPLAQSYGQTPSDTAFGQGAYIQGYMHGLHSASISQQRQSQPPSQMGHPSPGPPGYETPASVDHDRNQPPAIMGELEGDQAIREVEG